MFFFYCYSNIGTGWLKKAEFYQIELLESCFQLGRNTYDICDKYGNAQFGIT